MGTRHCHHLQVGSLVHSLVREAGDETVASPINVTKSQVRLFPGSVEASVSHLHLDEEIVSREIPWRGQRCVRDKPAPQQSRQCVKA